LSYIYLQFPELEDFIEYLKGKGIRLVGIVERVDRRATKAGVPMARYYFRLTAKDEERREVILCDITYYDGLEPFPSDREKLEKARKETEEKIANVFAEEASKGVIFQRIKAEYTKKPVKT